MGPEDWSVSFYMGTRLVWTTMTCTSGPTFESKAGSMITTMGIMSSYIMIIVHHTITTVSSHHHHDLTAVSTTGVSLAGSVRALGGTEAARSLNIVFLFSFWVMVQNKLVDTSESEAIRSLNNIIFSRSIALIISHLFTIMIISDLSPWSCFRNAWMVLRSSASERRRKNKSLGNLIMIIIIQQWLTVWKHKMQVEMRQNQFCEICEELGGLECLKKRVKSKILFRVTAAARLSAWKRKKGRLSVTSSIVNWPRHSFEEGSTLEITT